MTPTSPSSPPIATLKDKDASAQYSAAQGLWQYASDPRVQIALAEYEKSKEAPDKAAQTQPIRPPTPPSSDF